MVNLAIKDLVYDKAKLFLMILGLILSMILIFFGIGMLNGTLNESSLIIDKMPHEIWITQKNRENVLYYGTISNEIYEDISNDIGDYGTIEKFIYMGANIEYEDKLSSVQIIGYDLSSKYIKPWDIISGNLDDLSENNSVILDESVKRTFPGIKLNKIIKINDIELKVVGFCENSKWFMNSFAWMSLKTAEKVAYLFNKSNFYLIKLKNNANEKDIIEKLSKYDDIDVLTSKEISDNTKKYMIFESGMGIGVAVVVFMGFFVNLVLIFITMYTSVNEKISEFGTIKALGATKSFIYSLLMGQVLIVMNISFIGGLILSIISGTIVSSLTIMPFYIEPFIIIILYPICLVLGLFGSLIAVRRVNKIDPAIIFKS